MQKRLILAITLAALMLGGSFLAAQSAPNVTVYGRAHVTTDYLSNGDKSGLNLSSNSSRLGFKASTDLGGKLKAIMQIEQEVWWDNGAGNFASRDTFVGLQGEFGTIRFGHFDTPLKAVRSKTDFFGDQIGDARNLTRLRDNYGSVNDFDTRFRNSIHYRSPSLSGLVFDLDYSSNTDAGVNPQNTGRSAISTSLSYFSKAFYAAGAYEHKEETKSNAIRLGASYSFGDLKIAGLGQFATIKADGKDDQKISTFGVGASYKVAKPATLKAQYYLLNADGDDRNAGMFALGLDYSLGKAFRLLLAYASTSNDELARYTMSAGGHGDKVYPAQGNTASGFSFGFRYDF